MKRIAPLLIAGLLGTVTTVAASAALAPGSPVAMTRTTGFVVDAATPAMAVTCPSASRAVVTLATPAHIAGKVYTYGVFINGVNTANGLVQATSAGLVTVRRDIPNNRISTVQLRLNGTTFVNGAVSAHCGTTTTTASRGSATSYSLSKNTNGTVTRWNPCDGTIRVRVNPTGGGSGALFDAQTAIKSLAASTGLHFVYDGTTSFIPRSANSTSMPAPLVIAWASRLQTDYLGIGAIGEGGWRSSGSSTDGVHWTWKIIQGFVVLDPAARVSGGFGRGASRGALLMHELGHVAGLGHTNDALQVMSPVLSSTSYGNWGAGDKTGLTAVGASKGCVVAR